MGNSLDCLFSKPRHGGGGGGGGAHARLEETQLSASDQEVVDRVVSCHEAIMANLKEEKKQKLQCGRDAAQRGDQATVRRMANDIAHLNAGIAEAQRSIDFAHGTANTIKAKKQGKRTLQDMEQLQGLLEINGASLHQATQADEESGRIEDAADDIRDAINESRVTVQNRMSNSMPADADDPDMQAIYQNMLGPGWRDLIGAEEDGSASAAAVPLVWPTAGRDAAEPAVPEQDDEAEADEAQVNAAVSQALLSA
jgi:hypothetical protein